MQAIVYSEFGSPDVLHLEEIDKPVPKDREVLVRVRAAAANPLDWHFIRGEPAVMRLMGKPNGRTPGVDLAGQVEQVGAKVTEFRVGDEVFGSGRGAFAEYACASVDNVALKPKALTYEQAAAIPVAACTALHRTSRSWTASAGTERAHQRRRGRRRDVRRADREGARRERDRRVQHEQRRPGPLDRRR